MQLLARAGREPSEVSHSGAKVPGLIPYEDFPGDKSTVLITTGFDKIFKDNSIAQIQFMYCNDPLDLSNFNSIYSGNFSSKDLAFSEFTAFGQFTWAATPLLNFTLAAMWIPGS